MNYTHGGLPENEAQTWTDENKQKLGGIIAKIIAYDVEGYKEFYAMKRGFMVDVWNEYLDSLDKYRGEKGFFSLNERLAELGDRLITGRCAPIEEDSMDEKKLREVMREEMRSVLHEVIVTLCEAIGGPVVTAPVETKPNALPDPAVKEEKPKSGKKPEKQDSGVEYATCQETVAEEKPLRDRCFDKIVTLQKTKRAEVVGALAEYGAKRLPDVKDADLPALLKKLEGLEG